MVKEYRSSSSELLSRLKQIRKIQGLSQMELATASGLQQSHISKIETGSLDPHLSTVEELAESVGYRLVLLPIPIVPFALSLCDEFEENDDWEERIRTSDDSRYF